MLHFFLYELQIATHYFGAMGDSTNDTVFSWDIMVVVPL